jgi:hypothetical protein
VLLHPAADAATSTAATAHRRVTRMFLVVVMVRSFAFGDCPPSVSGAALPPRYRLL